ncbi:MAG: lysylphosphatidylglycerol synthase transmembrane domain-containing protein [Deltaproteobacteria bacterium]|nr:lysylphosphatidylglycerol synthase transmembrane domain-containing protein [Deltaproteobacteria bacterium]
MTLEKQTARSSKTLKFLLRACISLCILVFFLYRADISTIRKLLSSVHWTVWLEGIFMYLMAQILSTQRWRYLAHVMGFSGGFLHFLTMYFTGMFANLFLPSSVGGDAVRVLMLARRFRDVRGILSVLLDRGIGLFAMLLLAAFFSLMPVVGLSVPLSFFLWSSVGFLMLGMMSFPLLSSHLSKRWPGLTEYFSPLLLLYTSRQAWFWCLFISLLIQMLGFLIGFVFVSAIQMPLTFSQVAVSLSLVTLLSLLPVSLNGLGLREGGLVYLLAVWGIPQEQALTLGLFLFGVQCVCSLFGGFFYVVAWKDH